MTLNEAENSVGSPRFEVMPAGEWLERAGPAAVRSLFGELWYEGELAVLFGDTSSGKSILAVQIAESIAAGRPTEPFEIEVPGQKVLLLDLARSASQFARRYTAETRHYSGKVRPPKQFLFSENLIRVTMKGATHVSPDKLAPIIEQSGAKVVIIDSLAFLQRYSIPRETVAAMRELRRLQDVYGLSILVVANSSRVISGRGINAADIPCSAVVTSFADSIFAIGRSGSRSDVRYLKQIKTTGDDAYGAANVPYFGLRSRDGVFPSLHHIGYASEATLRAGDNDHWEWQRIRSVRKLADEGRTIRQIAAECGSSRSTVHRLLRMSAHAPPLPTPAAVVAENVQQFYARERCIVMGCYGCHTCSGRPARDFKGVSGTLRMGHNGDCPDDCDMCGPRRYRPDDTAADPVLVMASHNHFEALKEWLLSGKKGPKPVYPGARRYGHHKACWKPGSENWTEEQLHIYDRWIRSHPRIGPEPDFNQPRAGP